MKLLLATEFSERRPAISPDGRWLAYQSDESERTEIYVRPFPNVEAGKWPVSVGGGNMPVWAPDGRELFFLSTGEVEVNLMVAQVETGPTFRWTTPERLFGVGSIGASVSFVPLGGGGYDIAPDGNRFLFRIQNALDDTSRRGGLVFVLNWHQKLSERVPVN